MKISKFIAVLLLLCTMYSLCSCNQLHFHSSNGNLQNQNNNQDQQNTENQTFTYVYSVTQEVLHLPDCYHINFINPKFRVTYTGDISVLFAQGFTVCKDCFASDEEKEKPEKEPDPDEVPPEEATYVVNRSSLTIHVMGCYNIDKMSEKNVKYTNLSYEQLIETDHIPCGFCMPDEYKAYKEANPDKFKDK